MAKTATRRKAVTHAQVGAVARACRVASGQSQTELARTLHVTQSAVSMMEGGERRMTVVQLIQWCDALGVTPTTMLNEIVRQQ